MWCLEHPNPHPGCEIRSPGGSCCFDLSWGAFPARSHHSLYPGEPRSSSGMSLEVSAAPERGCDTSPAPAQPYQPLHPDDSKEIPAAFEALNGAGKLCQLGPAPIPAGKEQEHSPVPRVKLFQALSRGLVFVCRAAGPGRVFQVCPGAADVGNPSQPGLIPLGILQKFIIPTPAPSTPRPGGKTGSGQCWEG